ncbi:ClpP/crotonase [Cryphonectria parasitica EP155]|uniref:ClpP/crotonase n=1 Tax=Cryphonectria parasitica (strain ATCC 38755 / EP155) TaxID=660469 RepID=A0A9P4XU72_CRYP1|nr:ClpP/crotonase [Cryphonectria parasitica EP155]KAF3760916.1 ClpP/crotonase [Cryphonectria parasitica EP155]
MPEDDASKARSRLKQVGAHLHVDQGHHTQSKGRRRKRNGPPEDWSDILGQVKTLQGMARTPPTSNPGYLRQKQAGKLWVRERVDALLDAESFLEVGSVAGTIAWKKTSSSEPGSNQTKEEIGGFTPSNNVQGFGTVGGRKILFTADDFSIRAGHADGAIWAKTLYMEKLCLDLRLPMIKLVDGSSGGGSVTTIKKDGFSYVPPMPGFKEVNQQLNLGIPNAGAILGPAIGLGAARVTACHFSVMAADVGSLFNAGPHVVAKATFEEGLSASDLGGPHVHCTNGTIDNAAPDEKGCFQQIRRFLSYVPDCGFNNLPPVEETHDSSQRDVTSLRTIIPRRRQRAYAMVRLIQTVVDQGSWFEIGAGWGNTAVVGLGRMNGRPVGVMANNPEVMSGATDAAGAQKMTKHLNLCDVFNLPIIQFVDCPGYAVGTAAERQATMKYGVELGKAYFSTTVPIFSVLVRKCYGVAGGIMTDCRDPHHRMAWPSLESGSLPLEGGVEASHARELREAGDRREEVYNELVEDYTRLQNPVRTAAAFDIPEVIDPADTRRILCAWTTHMYDVKLVERLRQRQSGALQPVFR